MVIGRSQDRSTRESCLKQFLDSCAVSGADDQPERLREAACLLGLDPRSDEGMAFEAMVSCGAYESASLALLGDAASFILSRGGPGTCLASTPLADKSEEVVVEGTTLALALVAAHVAALLAEFEASPGALSALDSSPVSNARLH